MKIDGTGIWHSIIPALAEPILIVLVSFDTSGGPVVPIENGNFQ